MAEYSSLKVPELKKLLAEKSLSQTGNKADLIARLTDDDNKNKSASDSTQTAADAATPKEPEAAKPGEFYTWLGVAPNCLTRTNTNIIFTAPQKQRKMRSIIQTTRKLPPSNLPTPQSPPPRL